MNIPQTKESPLVSIVVPVYNQEPYLRLCLASIQEQTYKNLEVLLIDDGSTDDSAQICREVCEQDARFHLIQQENAGLGPARNTGLQKASGAYICFVDADDFLHPDYIRILYENLVAYQADLSICGFKTFEGDAPDQDVFDAEVVENNVQVRDQLGLLADLLSSNSLMTLVAWNKLVRLDWLQGFQFENKWHEDQYMINEYILRCTKAVVTTAQLYAYRIRPDSIMGDDYEHDLRHLDYLGAHEIRINYFYQPQYEAVWKDLLLANLQNKIGVYQNLYTKERAAYLDEQVCPSYIWCFHQYRRMGGLFRKGSHTLRLCLFRLSPHLYMNLRTLLSRN